MLSKKNHIINYFKEVKYISDQIGISKIEKLVKELVKIRKKKGRLFFLGIGGGAANSSHAVNDFRKI
jgi:D-sedoheptulose 7-phosphate isomerase